jgi:4-aminobutyrate aminotransferase-like enzyme/Ser/Thr protein kinase RdoA (MazF antagonist)
VFGLAEAQRLAQDVYGLSLTMERLPGERDSDFLGRTDSGRNYVLKIIDVGAEPLAADCQVRVLQHLAEQAPALAVPRHCVTVSGADVGRFNRDGRALASCLLSYLPGQPMAEIAVTVGLLGVVGEVMARLDHALQGFFHPALAQHLAWDVRRLPELRDSCQHIEARDLRRQVEHVIGVVQERLPRLRALRAQAIHGDCHGGNMLIGATGAVSGILDFGDMIHAPVIFEPAVAMSELLTEGVVTEPAALSPLLEGYARVAALDAAEVDLIYDLMTARHATTIVLHAWRTRHDPAGAALLEEAASRAAASLDGLLRLGPSTLAREWHGAAGTAEPAGASIDLARRHRLLGDGAELFYEKPLHLIRGEGVWLYDAAGRAYLDGYNNVAHVGHCHPHVVRAISRQTAVLATHSRYLHESILRYAERLLAQCPSHLDACIFVNSGSEANDVAWRMAQLATGRAGAVIMAHAYHGITAAVAALTPGAGEPQDQRVVTLAPPPPGIGAGDIMAASLQQAALADVDRSLNMLADRGLAPAAFFIDTAMTSSGIYDPPPAWAQVVTTRIRQAGGLIVADEVQYGLGRSGSHFWGFERRGIVPDIVTLGKPLGNGYPVGAVMANRGMIEAFQRKFGFFSTFGGNAVAAAAGLAVLEVIERERLRENAATTGAYLRAGLERLAAGYPALGAVRGCGLLLGLEVLADDAAAAKRVTHKIVNALAAESRILIGAEGPAANILKIRPPLPFRPEHADLMIEGIGRAAAMAREGC